MNLSSKKKIIARLRRGKSARRHFMESHLSKTTAFQIRAIRDALGWSQTRLGEQTDMNQNSISRLESANYGKATITTLKRLAEAFDVCLVVRFVPFSQMVDWVSGTPRLDKGLTTHALQVPSFLAEDSKGVFDEGERTDLLISATPFGVQPSTTAGQNTWIALNTDATPIKKAVQREENLGSTGHTPYVLPQASGIQEVRWL